MHGNIFPNIALIEEPLKNLFLLGEILAAMLKYWLLTVARFAVYIEIHVEMAFCMTSWLYYWLSIAANTSITIMKEVKKYSIQYGK